MFDNRAQDGKAIWFARRMIMRMTFFHVMAFFADEELCQMSMRAVTMIMEVVMKMIVVTRNESVQSFHAVNKTVP